MNVDFHYYGTYVAAVLAGYPETEAVTIAHAAGYVDFADKERTRLIPAPLRVQTTQDMVREIAPYEIDRSRKVDDIICRVWPVFHFLPGNFDQDGNPVHTYTGPARDRSFNQYWEYDAEADARFRLVCLNDSLTVARLIGELTERTPTLYEVGTRMHTLADTWAHTYFAGIPAWFLNACHVRNTRTIQAPVRNNALETNLVAETEAVRDQLDEGSDFIKEVERRAQSALDEDVARQIKEGELPADTRYLTDTVCDPTILSDDARLSSGTGPTTKAAPDAVRVLRYNSYLYLGHAQAGHSPDYAYQEYDLKPKWLKKNIHRNNDDHFLKALRQMVHAMSCLRNRTEFRVGIYDDLGADNERTLRDILCTPANDQTAAWRHKIPALRTLDGRAIGVPPAFDADAWMEAAKSAGNLETTALWAFNEAARSHLARVKGILATHNVYLDDLPQRSVHRLKVSGQAKAMFSKRQKTKVIGRSFRMPFLNRFYATLWRKPQVLEFIVPGAKSDRLLAGDVIQIRTPEPNARGRQYLGARRSASLYYDVRGINIGRQKWRLIQDGTLEGAPIDFDRPVRIASTFYDPTYYLAPSGSLSLIAALKPHDWTLTPQSIVSTSRT